MDPVNTIEVALGARSYPIHVTARLEGLGAAAAAVVPPGRIFVVTNPVVEALYREPVVCSLRAAGFEPQVLLIPDGEAHKTLETWAQLVEHLLEARIDRRTPVLSLGGGVTGDLVGFAAASVLRGVPFIQVPTTLLAMVDASVGGKTGFNTAHGKNMVGAFYQPRMVYAATEVLSSLDAPEWRCGLGESLKHGVIRDVELLGWMEENAASLRARDARVTSHLVRRCCEIKAEVVAEDEREAGLRAILNFGHTVGHALETALGHGRLRHGEAVSIGMLVETKYSIERGWCGEHGLLPRLIALSNALGLPVGLPAGPHKDPKALRDALNRAVSMDKKTVRGRLGMVVPVRAGTVQMISASTEDLVALMELTESWEIT
jgi:3-dehydroquinate synthase